MWTRAEYLIIIQELSSDKRLLIFNSWPSPSSHRPSPPSPRQSPPSHRSSPPSHRTSPPSHRPSTPAHRPEPPTHRPAPPSNRPSPKDSSYDPLSDHFCDTSPTSAAVTERKTTAVVSEELERFGDSTARQLLTLLIPGLDLSHQQDPSLTTDHTAGAASGTRDSRCTASLCSEEDANCSSLPSACCHDDENVPVGGRGDSSSRASRSTGAASYSLADPVSAASCEDLNSGASSQLPAVQLPPLPLEPEVPGNSQRHRVCQDSQLIKSPKVSPDHQVDKSSEVSPENPVEKCPEFSPENSVGKSPEVCPESLLDKSWKLSPPNLQVDKSPAVSPKIPAVKSRGVSEDILVKRSPEVHPDHQWGEGGVQPVSLKNTVEAPVAPHLASIDQKERTST